MTIKILRNSFEQFMGVMFKKLKQDDVYLFIFKKPLKNFYIHTFFCRQPLDIYLLDENWIVADKICLLTYLFKVFTLEKSIKYMVETLPNTLKIEINEHFRNKLLIKYDYELYKYETKLNL